MTKAVEDDLLDVAGRLFRRRGFEGTTVREIAKAAGILPGSLHYRYATKEALLLALMERAIGRAIAAVRAAAAEVEDPVEKVRFALRAHLRFLLAGDDGVYVLLYDWRALDGDARATMIRLRDRYEAFWDGLLFEAAGAGRLRPGVDLKLVRLLGFGAINWVAQWFSPKGERTPDQIADAFWACMAFGVLDDAHRPADLDEAFRGLSALEPAR